MGRWNITILQWSHRHSRFNLCSSGNNGTRPLHCQQVCCQWILWGYQVRKSIERRQQREWWLDDSRGGKIMMNRWIHNIPFAFKITNAGKNCDTSVWACTFSSRDSSERRWSMRKLSRYGIPTTVVKNRYQARLDEMWKTVPEPIKEEYGEKFFKESELTMIKV